MKTTKDGNTLIKTYDKDKTKNPIARFLYNQFKSDLHGLIEKLQINNILEIGCGKGDILNSIDNKFDFKLQGVDIEKHIIREAAQIYPNINFQQGDGINLSFEDDSFDLVLILEVLEHVEHIKDFILGAKRVARKHLIFSVPREPLFQILNFTRGAHLLTLGNAPGHINHWKSHEFIELLSIYFEIKDVKKPIPWTMVSCEIK